MTQTKLYKITKDPDNIENGVRRDDGNGHMSGIPKDPNNRDWVEYLEWVAAGNTAEAAD
tara:strand:- start:6 stop:182 length:177 start_codon:yes stop_codon:yes gene_type:complete